MPLQTSNVSVETGGKMDGKNELFTELQELIEAKQEPVKFDMSVVFLLKDKQYEANRVHEVIFSTDAKDGIGERVTADVEIGLGTYNHILYPNRHVLQAVVVRTPTSGNGKIGLITDVRSQTTVYDCTLVESGSSLVTDAGNMISDFKDSDDKAMTKFSIELVESRLNLYRLEEVSGIFRDVTVTDVLNLLCGSNYAKDNAPRTAISQNDWLSGDYTGVIGCEIVPADNERVYDHIVIPVGTKLIDLPDYLQVTYGVYKNGLGNFLWQGMLLVYPLTDTERVAKTSSNLTVGRIPPDSYPGVETTYKIEPNGRVMALATDNVKHTDPTDWNMLNKGCGVRFFNADMMFDESAETKPADATTAGIDLMTDLTVLERSDGLIYRPTSNRAITANPYHEESQAKANTVGVLMVNWDNSDHRAMYPGMPTKYLFKVGEEIIELHGTLLGYDTTYVAGDSGYDKKPFLSKTVMSIVVHGIGQ